MASPDIHNNTRHLSRRSLANPKTTQHLGKTIQQVLFCPKDATEIQPVSLQEDQEFLSQHSQLQASHGNLAIPQPYLAPLLGHIYGHHQIEGSTLEQLPMHLAAQAFAQALSSLDGIPECVKQLYHQYSRVVQAHNEARAQLDILPVLQQYAQKHMEAVQALLPGACYLIEGGSTDQDKDNTVIFEFVKNTDGSYDLYVYLTGAGERQYQERWTKEHQPLLHPVTHYKNIPAVDLFLHTESTPPCADFFQAILETRLCQHKHYTANYVAFTLLEHLQGYRAPFDASHCFWISQAHAHTDPWRAMKAVLQRHLNAQTYKQAIFDLKLNVLVQSFHQATDALQEDTKEARQLRMLLRMGAQKLLKTSLKSETRPGNTLSPERSLQARATAIDLRHHLDKIERDIQQQRQQTVLEISWAALTQPCSYTGEIAKAKATLAGKSIPEAAPTQFVLPMFLGQPSPSQLLDTLHRLVQRYQDNLHLDLTVKLAEIAHLINSLPIPSDESIEAYWEETGIPGAAEIRQGTSYSSGISGNRTPKFRKCYQLVSCLHQLLSIYHDAILKTSTVVSSKERIVVNATYAILHYYALVIDQELGRQDNASLSNYCHALPFLEDDPFLIFTSSRDYDRNQAIIRYFTPFYKKTRSIWSGDKEPIPLVDFGHPGFANYCEIRSFSVYCRALFGANETTRAARLFTFGGNDHEYLDHVAALFQALFLSYKYTCQPAFQSNGMWNQPLQVEVTYSKQEGDGYIFYVLNKDNKRALLIPSARNLSPSLLPALDKETRAIIHTSPVFQAPLKRTEYDVDNKPTYGKQTKEVQALGAPRGEFLRLTCAPELIPRTLLAHYRDRLFLLEDIQEQTLFELTLFRAIARSYCNDRTFRYETFRQEYSFPLQQELSQPGYLEALANFAEEGLAYYFYNQPNERPHVQAVTFFLRIISRITHFLEGGCIIDAVRPLEKMLECSDLTAQERSSLSLHLVFAYGALGHELADAQRKKLFDAWIFYKNTPLETPYLLLEKEAQEVVLKECTRLALDATAQENMMREVLSTLQLPLPSDLVRVETGNLCLLHVKHANGFFKLNLVTAELSTEEGVISREPHPSWLSEQPYQYVLKGQVKGMFRAGKALYLFRHPHLGHCRVDASKKTIQRELEGHWYQYVPAHQLCLPPPLLADHTHWVSLTDDRIMITHCAGENIAYVTQEGLKDTQGTLLWGTQQPHDILSAFEDPSYLIMQQDITGQQILTLPRYKSSAQEILKFKIEQRNGLTVAVYMTHPQYVLTSHAGRGFLGDISQYLLLENGQNHTQKLLVPLLDLRGERCSTDYHLALKEKDNTYLHQQQGTLSYFEYDVKEGRVTASTTEATLYLAYLYLSQRRYSEAQMLLKGIDIKAGFSTQGCRIVDTLIVHVVPALPKKEDDPVQIPQDTSPEAVAVALNAWDTFLKIQRRCQADGYLHVVTPTFDIQALEELKHVYLHHFPWFPEDLRFTPSMDMPKPLQSAGTCFPRLHSFTPYAHSSFDAIFPLAQCYPEMWRLLQPDTPISDEERTKCSQGLVLHTQGLSRPCNTTLALPTSYFITQADQLLQDYYPEIYTQALRGNKKRMAFFLNLMQHGRKDEDSMTRRRRIYLQAAIQLDSLPPIPRYSDRDQSPLDQHYLALLWEFITTIEDHVQRSFRSRHVDDSLQTESWGAWGTELLPPVAASILPPHETQATVPLRLTLLAKTPDPLYRQHIQETPLSIASSDWIPALELQEVDRLFESVLQSDYEEFRKDLQAGREIHKHACTYSVKDLEHLQRTLKAKQEPLQETCEVLEVAILELANQHKKDPLSYLQRDIKARNALTLKKLVLLFLKSDRACFEKANPYLVDPALKATLGGQDPIDALYQLMGQYLLAAVEARRTRRAEELCDKLHSLTMAAENYEATLLELTENLKALESQDYDAAEHPEFLVFEYLRGWNLRKDQIKLLKKLLETQDGKYVDRIVQLIMGGGKTDVIAMILLKLAAKKERLSLFVALRSQYSSVSHNLKHSLMEYFEQDMETIEFTSRDELDHERCQEIHQRLLTTMQQRDFLLVTPHTLQLLLLEFWYCCDQASKSQSIGPDMLSKINTLHHILALIRECADGLFDEADTIFNTLEEVTIPNGSPKHVDMKRIGMAKEVFKILAGDALKDRVKLQNNQQTLLSKQDLLTHITPEVVQELVEQCALLGFKKVEEDPQGTQTQLKLSFARYVSGEMSQLWRRIKKGDLLTDREQQTYATDQVFVAYLRQLHDATDPQLKERAEYLVLVKLMLQHILTFTFTKQGKRQYGRAGEHASEVRPYLAVDTPSEDLFGYHWEAIAYHMQTALQDGIKEEQLLSLAKLYHQRALQEAERENIPVHTTAEAKAFCKLIGVELHELVKPDKLKEALEKIHASIDVLLEVEALTAATYVTYYEERITATAHTLEDLVNTKRTMSGTQWNACCSELGKTFEPDYGTEGRIADRLLQAPPRVSVAPIGSLEEILQALLRHHPHQARVQMLMDSGALFKDYNNLVVAQALGDILKKKILFFTRNPKIKEKTPDTLAVWDPVERTVKIIGGTKLEDIEKNGLKIEDYFVFLDDRHTTGIDLPLRADAIGMMTVDENMLRRTLYQTVMRLRGFFKRQVCELIVPQVLLPLFGGDATDAVKVLQITIKRTLEHQARTKAEHFLRSGKQSIDHIACKMLLTRLRAHTDLNLDIIKKYFLPFRDVIVLKQDDLLYEQFGELDVSKTLRESLKDHADKKLAALKTCRASPDILQEFEQVAQQFVDHWSALPYGPSEVTEAGRELGMAVSVQTSTNIAQQSAQQTDTDVDIDQELNDCNMHEGRLQNEKIWSDTDWAQWINDVASKNLLGLSEQLFRRYRYAHPYGRIFSNTMIPVPSWMKATDCVLPVFHPKQRPLTQLLIIRTTTNTYRALVLSQYEAEQCKAYLTKTPWDNVWLTWPNGTLLQDATSALPDDPAIEQMFFEALVFNGTIDQLEKRPEQVRQWLSTDKELKLRWLKLRIARNPLQKQLFNNSPLFSPKQEQPLTAHPRRAYIRSLHQGQVQALTDPHDIVLLSNAQLDWITKDQITDLHPRQLRLLTRPDLIQHIPEQRAHEMTARQMPHIQQAQIAWFDENIACTRAMPQAFVEKMSQKQRFLLGPHQIQQLRDQRLIDELSPSQLAHLTRDQISFVTPAHVPHLRNIALIQVLPTALLHHLPRWLRQRHLTLRQIIDFDPATADLKLIKELTNSQLWELYDQQITHSGAHANTFSNTHKWKQRVRIAQIIIFSRRQEGYDVWAQKKIINDSGVMAIGTHKGHAASSHFYAFINGMSAHISLTQNPAAALPAPAPTSTPVAPPTAPHPQPVPIAVPPTTPIKPQATQSVKVTTASAPTTQAPPTLVEQPIPPTEPKKSPVLPRAACITKVAIVVITLLSTAAVIAGVFAVVGGHVSPAPHFMVRFSSMLPSPLMAYGFLGGGGFVWLCLAGYAIYNCRKKTINTKIPRAT